MPGLSRGGLGGRRDEGELGMRHIIASLLVAVALVTAACGGASAPAQSEGGTSQTQQASSGGEQQGKEDQGQESSPASSDTTQEQHSSTEVSSTSSSTSEPTESSEAEEPELAAPTLPGIAPPDIYLNLEKEPYGFQFGDWQWGENIHSKCGQSWDTDTAAVLTTCIYTDDVNHVVWIEADVSGFSLDAANWLLPYVATAPFEGNNPKKAAQWVKDNWRKVRKGKPRETVIGPAKFVLLGDGEVQVTLEIKPAKGFEEWLASLPTD